MPLYHFRITKGKQVIDPNGIDLPNADSAKRHGERLAGGLTLLSSGFGVRHLRDWYVQVMDEGGNTLIRYEVRPFAASRGQRQGQ